MRAKLENYYPIKINLSLFERLKITLKLGEIKDITNDQLLSPTLYTYIQKELDTQVKGVFNQRKRPIKYGNENYDTSIALRKNASQFSAHKTAYFTDWMKKSSKKEKIEIKKNLLRQLEVEKNIASRGARAAKQWNSLTKNSSLYPNLEYLPSRSAEKRESHSRYYGMILPIGHSFWNRGLPPNGWNCKCRVRATDKPTTKAIAPPEEIKGIAGNSGKQGEIFTQSHPFFRNVKDKNRLQKEWLKLERKRVTEWAKENVRNKAYTSAKGKVYINGNGIKEIINQNHDYLWEKNMLLYDLKAVIKKAEFVKEVPFIPSKKGGIRNFNSVLYFKIQVQKKDSYLVIKKEIEKKGGKMWLYDITDQIK